jgi:hypothetical protein
MTNNLVYIFLTSNFFLKENASKSQWSYDTLPEYYIQTFAHNSQKFTNAIFLSENDQIKKYRHLFPKNTKFISVEDEIINTEEFKEVQSILDTQWTRYRYDTFWYVTFMRTIVLGILIKKLHLTNTIHIEADNLIYSDQPDIIFKITQPGDFAYSNEAPHASALALMAFKDPESGSNIVKHHITLLKKGDQVLNPYVGHFYGHVTDMAFIDLIYRAQKNYKMLPCLPYGPFSENYSELQHVFDPISYGQYLGGTNFNSPPGYAEERHYVGKEIINNKIKVIFNKKPFIVYNDKEIPIFNLHLHNKKSIPHFLKNANS